MALAFTARGRFISRLGGRAVQAAIAAAEQRSSGEIRVSVAGFFRGDLRLFAERAFHRLNMSATVDRNGVLIVVVPSRRKLIILADQGIDERMGSAFWSAEADALAHHFKTGDLTAGLIETIQRIGSALAIHFPPGADRDVNELPDALDLDQSSI